MSLGFLGAAADMRGQDHVGRPLQAGHERLILADGSSRKTSIAAPARCPTRCGPAAAVVDHEAAAEVEEQGARSHGGDSGFPEQTALSGRPSTCRVTTSAQDEQLPGRRTGGRCRAPGGRRCRRTPPTSPGSPPAPTAASRCCRSRRCRAAGHKPRGPRSADLSQTPACMSRFFSVSRRVREMISAITSSTTLRVLENGALKTATPGGGPGQVDLVGADAERPHRQQAGELSSTASVTWVRERMPSRLTPGSARRARPRSARPCAFPPRSPPWSARPWHPGGCSPAAARAAAASSCPASAPLIGRGHAAPAGRSHPGGRAASLPA